MTKREKVLLSVLLVIVVMFLPHFFVTRKILTEYNTLKKEFNVLDLQRESYYTIKDALQEKEESALELEHNILKLQEDIADISKSYNAHYAFMDLAKKNNVRIVTLKINDIEDATEISLPPITNSQYETTETNDVIEPTIKPCKLVMDIAVLGKRDNIIQLVDDINKNSNNFIVQGFDATDLDAGDPIEVNISTSVYMVLTEEQRGQLK